ncbi:MAG: DUF2283 domain-containing protein [Chloroflexi bacterium]|nr:DUF2283 domain-containing protein [Chloroflexota bacterium]
MKITYDSEGDVLYIQVRGVAPVDSVDIEDGVTVELDGDGHLVALELLDASKRLTPEELTSVSYENLLLAASKVP